MINAGTVQVKLFANTKQYMTAMAAASNQMSAMAKSTTRFAKTAVIAFAAVTAGAAKMATDFDKRLREISTLVIGVTENDIKNMSREIRDLANVTGKSLDDIGKAKYDIISAGFTGMAESATLLNTSTRLAVGGVTSVTNAADLLTSALNSFAQSGFEAESASDILFTTVRLGKTTMDELVGSVGRVFPTAKALGASLADVGAAMATITAGGIKTYEAATYLNQAFTKLGAPSDQAAEAMRLYGISVKRTDDGMIDLFNTIKQFKGYDLETMRRFFPEIRAIKAVLAMANNLDFLKKALDQTGDSANATQVAFLKMKKSWSTQLSTSVMRFKDTMIELGNMVMPTVVNSFDDLITSLTKDLPKIADEMKGFVVSVGALAKTLAKVSNIIVEGLKIALYVGIIIGITKAVKSLTAAYIAFGPAMSVFIFSLTSGMSAIAAFDAALATTGVGLIVIAISAAIYGIAKLIGVITKSIKKNIAFNKSVNDMKTEFAQLGMSMSMVSEKAAKKAARKGTLLDIDEIGKIADALKNANMQFAMLSVLGNPDFKSWNKDVGSEISRIQSLFMIKPQVSYSGGSIREPFDLEKLNLQLKNLEEFNNSLKTAKLNTYKYTKEVFDSFNISTKPLEESVRTMILQNNKLADMKVQKLPFDKLGISLKDFESILQRLGIQKDSTLSEILSWLENFNKEANGTSEQIEYMNKSFKDLISTMNSMELRSGIGISVFLEKQGEMDILSGYSDNLDNLVSKTHTFGQQISQEFASIGDSISSTFADSFTEMILSGRTAMQELESYNKGLTNNFRTAAEIREEAWGNMWNNILLDTARALLEIAIKYTLLTGALMALDALSGGLLRGALSVSESVGGFWGGVADFFKQAGGTGFATTFGKRLNDGIVTPQGEVIKTAPDDYIMAMKHPENMFNNGGGSGDVYIIQAWDGEDVERVLMKHNKAVSRVVGKSINRRDLQLITKGKLIGASY